MAPEVFALSGLRRLADQLQTLSELIESLTYRLLELEEKVGAVDLRLQPLLDSRSGESALLADDTELRLDDTQERLSRLESLLAGLESASIENAGQADPQQALFDPEPHFPEEDLEQSFLDEQPAFLGEPAADDDHQERLIA